MWKDTERNGKPQNGSWFGKEDGTFILNSQSSRAGRASKRAGDSPWVKGQNCTQTVCRLYANCIHIQKVVSKDIREIKMDTEDKIDKEIKRVKKSEGREG